MAQYRKWYKDEYKAVCPLHIAWRHDAIMCKPAMPETIATVQQYNDPEAAQRQREVFCSTMCYERCEHYRAWKHYMWEEEE